MRWLPFVCACACTPDSQPVKSADPAQLPAPAATGSSIPQASSKAAPTSASSSSAAATHSFAFDTINGQGRVELAGHVSIVDFWATWCGPCKKAFPKLQMLYDRHKGEGVIVIGLAMDDEPDAPLEFVRARQTTFPVGLDIKHATYDGWKFSKMPTTVVLDPKGSIYRTYEGYHEGEDVELERDIRELLGLK